MPYFDALLENSSEYIAAYTAVYEHVYPLALKGAADGVIVPAMRRRRGPWHPRNLFRGCRLRRTTRGLRTSRMRRVRDTESES